MHKTSYSIESRYKTKYTEEALDITILHFVPHYREAELSRSAAVDRACIAAFVSKEFHSANANIIRQAKNDLLYTGFFKFSEDMDLAKKPLALMRRDLPTIDYWTLYAASTGRIIAGGTREFLTSVISDYEIKEE